MLANRLKILLAERDLTIKDLMKATGLSRNSLSNMVNNPFATIAIDNVDKLCNYLEVSPKDFYDYSGWRFEFNFNEIKENKVINPYNMATITITMVSGKTEFTFDLDVTALPHNRLKDQKSCDIYVNVGSKNELDKHFVSLYENNLSPLFKHQIEKRFKSMTMKTINLADKRGLLDDIKKNTINVAFEYNDGSHPVFQDNYVYDRSEKYL